MYSAKNHSNGPDETVIGGKLTVEAGATVTGINGIAAVATTQAANATAVATDLATAQALTNSLQTDFNALLVKLKAAGLMANS